MSFLADLHVHSKHSRATSKHSDLEHLHQAARRKGIRVVGTGDFTHPAWRSELEDKLEPAEPGLYRLREDIVRELPRDVGDTHGPVRFLLQVEISTIYKKGDRTRKIHHLLYVPDFERADRLIQQLDRVGNLEADGRPILGLDSRDLLEMTLEAGEGCHLVPAHIWTPWFSLFGSKSGFDELEACYGDLSKHVFALETGLSSDPPMNWRLSALDDYTLVSNSDAHSPPKLGREASLFHVDLDYFEMMQALRTGEGYGGTVEFYPEEGKYHLDGHRDCDLRLDPKTTRRLDGECPVCGGDLTVGVLHRVHELADRRSSSPPERGFPFDSLIPLVEILAEIEDVGPRTKTVGRLYDRLIESVGPELYLLRQAPLEEIEAVGRPLVTEGIRRMRDGEVIKQPGYDGEYGTIRLFEDRELQGGIGGGLLFDLPENEDEGPPRLVEPPEEPEAKQPAAEASRRRESSRSLDRGVGILEALDEDQRRAVETTQGPLLVLAGPGTGKTRTLTHRIAHLVVNGGTSPERCLAVTFTRRAAGEMRERLAALTPHDGEAFPVTTFHGFGYRLLGEFGERLGLGEEVHLADPAECLKVMTDVLDGDREAARRELDRPRDRRGDAVESAYREGLRKRGRVDYGDLIELPVRLLEDDPEVRERLRTRYRWISVDEYQDVSARQYRLIRLLAPDGNDLCVIGDPDQAIYGFRGGDVRFFERFREDYPDASTVRLTNNYRSTPTVLRTARRTIEPDSLVEDRTLRARRADGPPVVLKACSTERAEAEFVVHSVEQLMGGTTFFSFDSQRVRDPREERLSFADVAVLYRTTAQSRPLIEAFDRSGIPYRRRADRNVTDHPLVREWLDHMAEAGEDRTVAARLETAVEAVEPAPVEGIPAVRSDRLLDALRPIARQCGSSLERFHSRLALEEEVDLWDPRADCVSLLTLHAAKGLEFSVVFIVGCEEGFMPLRWGEAEPVDRAEERRLLFVGMTRSRRRLYLTRANRRSNHGGGAWSPFLDPIDDDLVDRRRTGRDSRTARASPAGQLDLLGGEPRQ